MMNEHMYKTLNDRLSEQQKQSELFLLQSEQQFRDERDSEVEKCSQMHTQELNEKIGRHKADVEKLETRFKQRVDEYEKTIWCLETKLQTLQEQERDQADAMRDLQAERSSESSMKDKTIARLETEVAKKDREIEKQMHKSHSLETRYELLRAKMQDITSNMASQVAYMIDELREELSLCRNGMAQMADDHQNSLDDVKRIYSKINLKMAENLDEVTQERDNFED